MWWPDAHREPERFSVRSRALSFPLLLFLKRLFPSKSSPLGSSSWLLFLSVLLDCRLDGYETWNRHSREPRVSLPVSNGPKRPVCSCLACRRDGRCTLSQRIHFTNELSPSLASLAVASHSSTVRGAKAFSCKHVIQSSRPRPFIESLNYLQRKRDNVVHENERFVVYWIMNQNKMEIKSFSSGFFFHFYKHLSFFFSFQTFGETNQHEKKELSGTTSPCSVNKDVPAGLSDPDSRLIFRSSFLVFFFHFSLSLSRISSWKEWRERGKVRNWMKYLGP